MGNINRRKNRLAVIVTVSCLLFYFVCTLHPLFRIS